MSFKYPPTKPPTCRICGEDLVNNEDLSTKYCPRCIWDFEHYLEGVPYPEDKE